MSRAEALPRTIMAQVETGSSGLADLPLLIQVPTARTCHISDTSSQESAFLAHRQSKYRRSRRRLRREFRLAGVSVLALFSLSLVCNPWSPMRGNHVLSAAILSITASQGRLAPARGIDNKDGWDPSSPLPPVLLSIEPAGAAAETGCEIPVVFPGYLLPDDNHEDTAHEGS
jgi:hypothetical protein